MGVRVACTFITKNASAPRLQPWYTEQPTEEEVEKMKETTEEHVGKASGGGTSDGAPTELIDRANELEWPDTTTMAGKKEAANLMVELCTSGGVVVDLPQDEKKAKMSVGKIIVGNPGASCATEILELIVKEFGIASKKLALAEQQKQAISVSCACPANAGVMQAFLELADLYFKEGNSNAAGSVSSFSCTFVFNFAKFHTTFLLTLISLILYNSIKEQRLQLWAYPLRSQKITQKDSQSLRPKLVSRSLLITVASTYQHFFC